ncbi:hypothetical protein ACKUDU_26545, partial [Klebsiella pneumoniae]
KIGPDPRNFNQRVSLGRNDLLIRTFPNKQLRVNVLASPVLHSEVSWCRERFLSWYSPHSH